MYRCRATPDCRDMKYKVAALRVPVHGLKILDITGNYFCAVFSQILSIHRISTQSADMHDLLKQA